MQQFLVFFLLISNLIYGQTPFRAIIRDVETKEPLVGASGHIDKLNLTSISGDSGRLTFSDIPNGEFEIEFSFTGYESKRQKFTFPVINHNEIFEINLEKKPGELDQVIVSTTRSSRSVKDIPTKVDVLASEDLKEKGEMKPADLKLVFNETTGIALQQTSVPSGATNIRIQGLNGRYTQLLRDGMPLYEGFSAGLSILQIAPIDLEQVEFVKGSASTLYGGGAIAGLVNLISRSPQPKRELTLLLNGTTAGGFDAAEFYSHKWEKVGATIFSSYNYNAPYDPANIGIVAIPKLERFSINPKLFLYGTKSNSAWFGINITHEDRYGGDIKVVDGNEDSIHRFFERNKTIRLSTQFSFVHQINERGKINIKNAIEDFDRKILRPDGTFDGHEVLSFTEINYSYANKRSEWIGGLNFWTDHFTSPDKSTLNYNLATIGVFVQNTFKPKEWVSIEAGLRTDYSKSLTNDKPNELFVLPRVAVLFKINKNWTSRISGGFGYKMPSLFSAEAEQEGYNAIRAIAFDTMRAERSCGANADVIYKTFVGDVSFTIDQLFFYTYLNRPLLFENNSFANANGFTDTKGWETNLKVGLDELNLYVGYTYTDTRQHFDNQNNWQPLTPKHLLNVDLAYERENDFRTGVEADYTCEQRLSDGTTGKGYVVIGFLFEKIWKYFNLYVNAENLTDRRQTRWDTIYSGTITNPVFKEIYAPLEGIVMNAGVKIKL